MKARYELTQTEFHGGRHISYHRTLRGACIAKRRYAMGDCICGCAVIGYSDESRTGEDYAALQDEIAAFEAQAWADRTIPSFAR